MKNLFNPTKKQIEYRNRLWADALLKSRKCRNKMRDDHGGRCCLGVAEDIAIKEAAKHDRVIPSEAGVPNVLVKEFFGWNSTDPRLKIKTQTGEINNIQASMLNDAFSNRFGLPHKKIAECVLNTFVRPSKFKQSFKINKDY